MLQITSSKKVSQQLIQKSSRSLSLIKANAQLGFKDLPVNDLNWQTSHEFMQRIAAKFSHYAVLGLGGSSLGAKAAIEALKFKKDSKTWFFDNLDVTDFAEFKATHPDWRSWAFLVISKSGTTLETVIQTEFLITELRLQKLNLEDHLFFITENTKNPLREFAEQNLIHTIDVPLNVGGRFSVLSSVGLVPIGLADLSLEKLRKGALKALQADDKVAEVAAALTESFERQELVSYLWFYSSNFRQFGNWLQQLWAESLGKKLDRQGQVPTQASIPLICVGATDQHSLLQQCLETKHNIFNVFFTIKNTENDFRISNCNFKSFFYLSERSAHDVLKTQAWANLKIMQDLGLNTLHFELEKLDEFHLGYLFLFWELVIATVGENLNIDAFNQPSVELGKSLVRNLLSK
jgi:glucose-6-phosphate isomerase